MDLVKDVERSAKEWASYSSKVHKRWKKGKLTQQEYAKESEIITSKRRELQKKELVLESFMEKREEEMEGLIAQEVKEVKEIGYGKITASFGEIFNSPTYEELEKSRPYDYFIAHCKNWETLSRKDLVIDLWDYFKLDSHYNRIPVADFVYRKLTGKGLIGKGLWESRK